VKTLPSCDCAALVLNPLLCVSVPHDRARQKIDLEITGAQIDISLLEGLDKEHLSVSREVNMNGDYNIPAAVTNGNDRILAAALETDSQLLSGKSAKHGKQSTANFLKLPGWMHPNNQQRLTP